MLRGEFVGKSHVRVTVQLPTSDEGKPKLRLEGASTESESPEPVGAHADGT